MPLDGNALGINASNVKEAIEYLIGNGTGGGPVTVIANGPLRVEHRVITEAEASDNALNLSLMPANSDYVAVDIVGGVPQLNGIDFSVSGSRIDWSIGDLNGLIANGDIIRITYSAVPEFKILHIELTQQMIDDAYYELPTRATYPDQVVLDVIGGVPQSQCIDFTCDGLKVDWSVGDLASLLEIGDYIRIAFLG